MSLMGCLLVILGMGIAHAYLLTRMRAVRPRLEHHQALAGQRGRLQEKYQEALQKQARSGNKDSRESLHQLIKHIADRIPENVRLDEMRFEAQKQLCLTGTARNLKDLTSFFKKVKNIAQSRHDMVTEISKGKNGLFMFTAAIKLQSQAR